MRKLSSTLFVVAALGVVSCVPGNSPIRIVGVFPVNAGTTGTGCQLDSKVGQTTGKLDVSGGGDYLIVLELDSELDDSRQIITSSGAVLTGPGRKNYVVDGVAVSYSTRNLDGTMTGAITFAQTDAEVIPAYLVIKPNTTGTRLGTDIIGDKGAKKLRENFTDPALRLLLTVNVQVRGHLESGETVPSNTVSFPIELFSSDANCTNPGEVTRTGPCGSRGGQDGTLFQCCTAAGTPVGCP